MSVSAVFGCPLFLSDYYLVDLSKDHRHRQFLLTMHEHREQLIVYLDSLKQALNSLDRLASLEPTRNEIQLTNIK